MQVKVCGLTQPANITAIAQLGVDYLGLIFYKKSKRYAESKELQQWLATNPEEIKDIAKVGVFVNAGVDILLNTIHDYQLDYVQLHGDESPGYCQELQLLWTVDTMRKAKIIKAFSVTEDFNFAQTAAYESTCALFIFDTGGQSSHGGTGVKWDWSKLNEYQGKTPFLLSGGIGPEDVVAVSDVNHPKMLGVDLNSKFESAPGVKDVELLSRFLRLLALA